MQHAKSLVERGVERIVNLAQQRVPILRAARLVRGLHASTLRHDLPCSAASSDLGKSGPCIVSSKTVTTIEEASRHIASSTGARTSELPITMGDGKLCWLSP